MVKRVNDNTDTYLDGYKYLLSHYPGVIHMLSAYELTSFKRTLVMLEYDFHGLFNFGSFSDKDIERFVCHSGTQVKGVAVRAYFEEYTEALDYEEYLIILADDYDCFNELYDVVKKRNGKYEVITFREEERKYLEKKCNDIYIHFWDVYLINANSQGLSTLPIEYGPFSDEFIDLIKQEKTDESNPMRYYMFANKGIDGYSVWAYFEDGNLVMFASVMPYFNDVAEIKIAMIEDCIKSPKSAVYFLESIVRLKTPQYNKAVLRVKNYSEALNSILNESSFKKISEEQHFHLEDYV